MAIFVEVGPGVVRPFGGEARLPAHAPMERAALAGVDDPVVLVEERPVATVELWRTLLGAPRGNGPVTAVYPSWWPAARVERIRAVAAGDVAAVTRTAVIREHLGAAVVVEIATDAIAVIVGQTPSLFGRDDIAGVAAAVSAELGRTRPATAVVVDVPRGVARADTDAADVCAALGDDGITAVRADLGAVLGGVSAAVSAAVPMARAHPTGGRRRRRLAAGVGALCAGLLLAATVLAVRTVPAGRPVPPPDPAPAWSSLVEGRIAVRVPSDWAVRRVTSGPGSRRVEVASPNGAVVHITQAHAPGTTLADAADALARAVAAHPAGVFTEFRPEDRVGERTAVTYRELRPGRTVRWSVVLAGETRISVGCQDPPAPAPPAQRVCAEAVASARELAAP